MKKALLLLFAGVLLVLASLSEAPAQAFHRIGHANRSLTKKAEHSNKHVKHRDKKKVKKGKPDKGERKRRREAKRNEKRRAEGPIRGKEATEPKEKQQDN